VGIEPSVGLQRLEQAILAQDPALDLLVPARPPGDSQQEGHERFSSAAQHAFPAFRFVQELHSAASITSLAIGELNDRLIVVAGNEDATVLVWDLASSNPSEKILTGHAGPVWGVALGFLHGRLIAVSASDDQTLRVWDVESGSPVGPPLTGHTDWVNSVAIAPSPDGRLLVVSGSSDQTVRIWDLESAETVTTLTGHTARVRAVTLGVLGGRAFIVSGGNDNTVRVWALEDDRGLPLQITKHAGPVRTVASGVLNGRPILLSGGEDRMLQIWQSTESTEVAEQRDQVEWLSDTPADKDLLRRRPLAQVLATRLRRIQAEEPDTSFLLHIDGTWGTGKSTLLNFLRAELQQDWVIVEFDAWREARVGPPWWALLAALRHGLQRDLGFPARVRLRLAESWARLHRAGAPFVLALTVLVIAASAVFLLLQPSDLTLDTTGDLARTVTAVVTALGTLWAGTLVAGRFLLWDSARGARLFEQSNANPMQDVTDHFGWLVAKATRPVVFFIDDLDRCMEGYVVELLDAVQTLIRDATKRSSGTRRRDDVAACFIVAADGAWIRKSYEIAYDQFSQSVGEPGRPLGYLFLDKLFQLRVPVPSIDMSRQQHYLRELLRIRAPDEVTRSLGDEEQAVRRSLRHSSTETEIIETLREASTEVRDRVAGAAVEKLATPAVEAATEHSLQRFGPLLTPNPRSMKRFVNTYSALRAVRTLEGNPVRSEPLALWTILETRWPSLADYLRANPEAIELLGKPSADLAVVPADLQMLFGDPAVRRLAEFEHGGPLTPELLRACCGVEPWQSDPNQDTPPSEA
jgi:hypothetical protein